MHTQPNLSPEEQIVHDYFVAHDMQKEAEFFAWGQANAVWLQWLFEAEQAHCDHPTLVNEDWGGPESGGVAGHCPRCGFSYRQVMY